MDSERMITLRVREPARRATKFVFEDGVPVEYQGGECATLQMLEALTKLGTGNFDPLDELTDNEQSYVEALMDRTWAGRHGGRYPKPSDFQLEE